MRGHGARHLVRGGARRHGARGFERLIGVTRAAGSLSRCTGTPPTRPSTILRARTSRSIRGVCAGSASPRDQQVMPRLGQVRRPRSARARYCVIGQGGAASVARGGQLVEHAARLDAGVAAKRGDRVQLHRADLVAPNCAFSSSSKRSLRVLQAGSGSCAMLAASGAIWLASALRPIASSAACAASRSGAFNSNGTSAAAITRRTPEFARIWSTSRLDTSATASPCRYRSGAQDRPHPRHKRTARPRGVARPRARQAAQEIGPCRGARGQKRICDTGPDGAARRAGQLVGIYLQKGLQRLLRRGRGAGQQRHAMTEGRDKRPRADKIAKGISGPKPAGTGNGARRSRPARPMSLSSSRSSARRSRFRCYTCRIPVPANRWSEPRCRAGNRSRRRPALPLSG